MGKIKRKLSDHSFALKIDDFGKKNAKKDVFGKIGYFKGKDWSNIFFDIFSLFYGRFWAKDDDFKILENFPLIAEFCGKSLLRVLNR